MLMVNQVKGQNKVMNVRLVQYLPIVHDLTKHFTTMYLDWVPREENEQADDVSRRAIYEKDYMDRKQPDFFKITFF